MFSQLLKDSEVECLKDNVIEYFKDTSSTIVQMRPKDSDAMKDENSFQE